MTSSDQTPRDGRDTRWEAHRIRRRRQLVEATLRAIRRHGAGVGMDEIAAEAGTSKTVLYRHLGDRAGLYRAVVEAVDATIVAEMAAARASADDVVGRIGAMARAYLQLVDRDPEIYRFVMTRPLETPEGAPGDPVGRITGRVGEELRTLLTEHLSAAGRGEDAPRLAPLWGDALVGLTRSSADHFLAARGTDRALTIDEVTDAILALLRPQNPPAPSASTAHDTGSTP